jgi:gamma-glutamyltranspeptidase
MLSSMKPAFVKPPGKNLTVGTAGGNRIITM